MNLIFWRNLRRTTLFLFSYSQSLTIKKEFSFLSSQSCLQGSSVSSFSPSRRICSLLIEPLVLHHIDPSSKAFSLECVAMDDARSEHRQLCRLDLCHYYYVPRESQGFFPSHYVY